MEDSLLPLMYPESSSIGDQTVEALQGSNSPSKLFTFTSLVPVIFLNPSSGPVIQSVDIAGAGFAPSSTVTIKFNGSAITTIPSTVTTTTNGLFSANFTVLSPVGLATVLTTQGANSASKTFNVTSSLAATSLSNFRSIEAPNNQSTETLVLPFNNKSNASAPVIANSTFNTAGSNVTISLHNKAPPANTSSSQVTENASLSPTAKELNNTSLISSTDTTINNNPSATTSTQANDTSNSNKSSERSISIGQAKSKDQLAPTALSNETVDVCASKPVTVMVNEVLFGPKSH